MRASAVRLTEWTTCGGCVAKWGGAPLRSLLADVAGPGAPELLVGLAPFDDAAVVRLSAEAALVSTTDFFPPLVDDPADFGAIAAANACSDVFAMGGRVLVALNIAAFPEELPLSAVEAILSAASAVVREAGGVVAGGHTIRSPEPIFGLAVQGIVDPEDIWTKGGACPGDVLVLSKPLGTGIVLAGGDDGSKSAAITGMRRLNRDAADELRAIGPRAVTDVTGFGLLGHAWEMAERSGCVLRFDGDRLPLYAGVREAAEAGVRTGGDARNRAYLDGRVRFLTDDPALEAIAFDPQTSGGLLVAVPPAAVGQLASGSFTVVGEVVTGDSGVELR